MQRFVCPHVWWGLQKVSEKHVFTTQMLSITSQAGYGAEPAAARF